MSKILTNHHEVRKWIEERKGVPAAVESTYNPGDAGIVRIMFPATSKQKLNIIEINWEEFFEAFDKKNIALLCQDKTKDGELSRFFKFINRK